MPNLGKRLNGQVAVVTGAAHGIGLAISKQLAAEGAKVVMADILQDAVRESAKYVSDDTGSETLPWSGDLSAMENVQALLEATRSRFGLTSILINNAGGGVIKPFLDHTPETCVQPSTAIFGLPSGDAGYFFLTWWK